MNEFDNFVNEREKAIKRAENHITDLRKMETIDFAFGGMLVDEDKKIMQVKPRLSEIDRKIQTQIFLANVGATHSMNIDVEEKARLICNLAKSFEEVVR